jgi:hypothetical protein
MIYKLPEGTFVISDGGTWLPGVYETEQVAQAAIDMHDDSLYALWESVLAAGRDTITAQDLWKQQK